MTFDAFQDALRGQIGDLLGVETVWVHPNAPRCAKPYVTLTLFGLRQVGQDVPLADATGQMLTGAWDATLSVSWYGAQALYKLSALAQALRTDAQVTRASGANYALYRAEPVLDTTTLIGTVWEERATLDLHVRFAIATHEDIGQISTVVIAADYRPEVPAATPPVGGATIINTVK